MTIIDFSRVGLIDFSCADEIVATLVRRACGDAPGYDGCFLFDGISDAHLDAIEHVLERDELALVVRISGLGVHRLIGVVAASERAVWELIARDSGGDVTHVAAQLAMAEDEAARALAALERRRLVMRDGARFRAPLGLVA